MVDVMLEWFARIDGQLGFRLLLQPILAIILGYRDGIRDWTNADPVYFWNTSQVLPEERSPLLARGICSTGKIFALAIGLDCLFQLFVTGALSLVGAFVVATTLAVIPYLLTRATVNQWKCRTRNRRST